MLTRPTIDQPGQSNMQMPVYNGNPCCKLPPSQRKGFCSCFSADNGTAEVTAAGQYTGKISIASVEQGLSPVPNQQPLHALRICKVLERILMGCSVACSIVLHVLYCTYCTALTDRCDSFSFSHATTCCSAFLLTYALLLTSPHSKAGTARTARTRGPTEAASRNQSGTPWSAAPTATLGTSRRYAGILALRCSNSSAAASRLVSSPGVLGGRRLSFGCHRDTSTTLSVAWIARRATTAARTITLIQSSFSSSSFRSCRTRSAR